MKYSNKLYVLKRIIDYFHSKESPKEIGRTKIQKLMFLINQNFNLGLEFTLYHYGPYSYEVADMIEFAVNEGFITEEWNGAVGYRILPTDKLQELEPEEGFTVNIESIISQFENYSVKDLSIIATGLLVKQQSGIVKEQIPKRVQELKPKHKLKEIEELLANHI
jgi:uncharacterized protein YwgA